MPLGDRCPKTKPPPPPKIEKILPGKFKKAKRHDLAVFSRQMSTLLKGGLPLARCMKTVVIHQADSEFQSMISAVLGWLEEGMSFSQALAISGGFPEEFIVLINLGEQLGRVDDAFERVTLLLEKETDLARKVSSAMIYPMFALGVGILVSLGIDRFVFPIFIQMFQGMERGLPFISRLVMAAVDSTQNPVTWEILAVLGLASVQFYRVYSKNTKNRIKLDRMKLRLPVVGKLYMKLAAIRFCRTLSLLSGGGVPIAKGLLLCASMMGNKVMEEEVKRARAALMNGDTLSDSFNQGELFPKTVVQMLQLAETTGKVPEIMMKAAEYYDSEIDYDLQKLSVSFEPIVIGIIGVAVATFMIGVFLPLYQILTKLAF